MTNRTKNRFQDPELLDSRAPRKARPDRVDSPSPTPEMTREEVSKQLDDWTTAADKAANLDKILNSNLSLSEQMDKLTILVFHCKSIIQQYQDRQEYGRLYRSGTPDKGNPNLVHVEKDGEACTIELLQGKKIYLLRNLVTHRVTREEAESDDVLQEKIRLMSLILEHAETTLLRFQIKTGRKHG